MQIIIYGYFAILNEILVPDLLSDPEMVSCFFFFLFVLKF